MSIKCCAKFLELGFYIKTGVLFKNG